MEGQWDRPPASLLASTPEPPQHRHLYPPHRHHHHSTTIIPHRLRRFATSPLTCLRSASYHSSPSRITSSSSSFFTLTQPPLLKLHLPPPPLHRRRAPPSEAAPSQIFVLALLPSCFTMHWPNVPFSTAAACLHSVAPCSQSLAAIARRSCSSLVLVLVCSCLTCTCAHSTLRSQYTCPESCAYHSAVSCTI